MFTTIGVNYWDGTTRPYGQDDTLAAAERQLYDEHDAAYEVRVQYGLTDLFRPVGDSPRSIALTARSEIGTDLDRSLQLPDRFDAVDFTYSPEEDTLDGPHRLFREATRESSFKLFAAFPDAATQRYRNDLRDALETAVVQHWETFPDYVTDPDTVGSPQG